MTKRRRVCVVDDDWRVCFGQGVELARSEDLDVVATLTTAQVLERGVPPTIDLALIDSFDRAQTFDRFTGVKVARRIRDDAPSATVVVASAHADNEYLRLRLIDAGAHFLYPATELRDPTALTAAVRRPNGDRSLEQSGAKILTRLGLRSGASPNTLLALIESMSWEAPFLTTSTQASLGVPRRHIIKLRELVSSLGGLETAPHLRGGGPTDRGTLPTWREARGFVRRLTGLELRREMPTHA